MRKQHSAKPRNRRMASANYRLSESVRASILGCVNSIDGGEDFASTYLRKEFLAKFCDESLVPASERRSAAIGKFRDCELKNSITNEKFRSLDLDFQVLPKVTMRRFLRFCRNLIRDILGPLRDEVVLGAFSGGASTSRRRTESHPASKFTGMADATESAATYVEILYRHAPLLRKYGTFDYLNEVSGNVLFTVPKKTDIDRCACKEPDFNMFLQKGVGTHIRRRLRRFGIDLNDQSINRDLAKRGSLDGSLATLDLSAASDSISFEVVRTLLPDSRFRYLDDIRSPVTVIDGEIHQLEMFSSMGNGFTFELESLIFFALLRTVAYFEGISGVISVYGDDLIIPSGMSDLAIFVLGKFGFTVNEEKSFTIGPFRESCGGHYLNGVDVTPFYLKRTPTHLTDLIRVCNQLRRWAMADWGRRYELPIYAVWRSLASFVPQEFWGGRDYSLDTILVSPHEARCRLVRVSEKLKLPDRGLYLFWHSSNWDRSPSTEVDGQKPVSTNQICRRRRAPQGDSGLKDLFWEELVQ